ncbi:hypothetical protein LBMAG16_08810 [Actinomycetes bacterium]|nr:hypothetical protein LBMAG16_08810 [Actinomycetes bacterium]
MCDQATWLTLVESSFQLGDRLLYLTSPLLRGDDVSELQQMLSRTGFDCGRVDGYLGKKSAKALTDFQQNYGVVADGICGPATLQALTRASRHSGVGPGVGVVIERHTAPKYGDDLAEFRVVIGQFGSLDKLTHELGDRLRAQHTHVAMIHDSDPHRHAQLANDFAADLYIGIESRETQVCDIAYYHTQGFHSVTGHVFATLAAEAIERSAPWFTPTVNGMRLQVLRETTMPAVVCGLGPVNRVIPHCAVIADDLANAMAVWVKTTSMKFAG